MSNPLDRLSVERYGAAIQHMRAVQGYVAVAIVVVLILATGWAVGW